MRGKFRRPSTTKAQTLEPHSPRIKKLEKNLGRSCRDAGIPTNCKSAVVSCDKTRLYGRRRRDVPAVIVFVGICYNRSCSFMIHLGLQFSWISLFRAKVLGQERRMAMRSSTLAFEEELQEHRIVLSFTQ
jgi:hypothetical protein